MHDVDLVIVYGAADHPDWGLPGASAADALDYTTGRVKDLLGAADGSAEKLCDTRGAESCREMLGRSA